MREPPSMQWNAGKSDKVLCWWKAENPKQLSRHWELCRNYSKMIYGKCQTFMILQMIDMIITRVNAWVSCVLKIVKKEEKPT